MRRRPATKSENPIGIQYNSSIIKKKNGVLKGELKGQIMTKFIGLRPKLYSFRVAGKDYTSKGCERSYNKKLHHI